jgi:hypothetical protein
MVNDLPDAPSLVYGDFSMVGCKEDKDEALDLCLPIREKVVWWALKG